MDKAVLNSEELDLNIKFDSAVVVVITRIVFKLGFLLLW